MSGSDHRKRIVARDVLRTVVERGSTLHIRKRLLKGRRERHPNAIRSKEDRGSSSDAGRRNAIGIVIRRDG